MDYEKLYKEALSRARHYQKENGSAVITAIFPELEGREDERIRKAIIESLPKYGYLPQTSIKVEDAVAWLEKQGERNSYKITFEDALALECAMRTVKNTEGGNELYKMLDRLYNKLHNAYLAEKQGKQNPDEADLSNCSDEYRRNSPSEEF